MESFDTQKAQRVWERVRAGGEMIPVELLEQSRVLAGLYLGLCRRLSGKDGEKIRDLYRQHQALMSILRGICRLGGKDPTLPPMEPGGGSPRNILGCCYLREKRLWEGLGSFQGTAFADLAPELTGQGIRRGIAVLEVLGRTTAQ